MVFRLAWTQSYRVAVAEQIRATNEEKRFDAPTWDTFLSKMMLVVTELHEAVQATQPGGQRNLAEELADAWIRLVDVLQAMWPAQWAARTNERAYSPYQSLEALLWNPLAYVCIAVETWRKGKVMSADVRMCVEYAIAEVEAVAAVLDLDLAHAIEMKMAKNAKRPVLHGKAESA